MEKEKVIMAKDIICLSNGMVMGVEKSDSAIFSYSHIAKRMQLFIEFMVDSQFEELNDNEWRNTFFDSFVVSSFFPNIQEYSEEELKIALEHFGESSLEIEAMVIDEKWNEKPLSKLSIEEKGTLIFKLTTYWLLNERQETKEVKLEEMKEALESVLLKELNSVQNTRAFHVVMFS